MIAMRDAGHIIGAYAATFVGIALYTWRVLTRARKGARQVPPEERPWT